MRKLALLILIAALAALLLVAPNALWLERSSALVDNNSADPVTLRVIISDDPDQEIELGTLAPGASRFLWIDPVGEATLAVELHDDAGWRRHCGEYVEAGMYRVEITVAAPDRVECKTELPLLNRLFIVDYLS